MKILGDSTQVNLDKQTVVRLDLTREDCVSIHKWMARGLQATIETQNEQDWIKGENINKIILKCRDMFDV